MSHTQGEAGPPGWLEPELATLTRDRFSDPAWIFERKLDGERCLAFADGGGVRLMTRNQHDISSTFPEITGALAAQRHGDDFIVDGEIVAFDKDQTKFSLLQHRFGVINPGADLLAKAPVYYYLFDVLYAGGRDVRPLPLLSARRSCMACCPSRPAALHRAPGHRGGGVLPEACARAGRGSSPSAPTRRTARADQDWLKFKCLNGQEFVIGGFTDPQRSRIGFGALLLGYYGRDGKLPLRGKVGTGFDRGVRWQPARVPGRHRAARPRL